MPTILEVRIQRGWTQAELSAATGLSTAAISRLENGEPVRRTTLNLVCQALGVNTGEITGVNLISGVGTAVRKKKRQ